MLEKLIADLRKYDPAEISYKSGVSLSTVNALRSGSQKNPTIKTVEALQKFVEEKQDELSIKGR